MSMSDYNGDLRKGPRAAATAAGGAGLVFRPNSKDVGPVETGAYGDKVCSLPLQHHLDFIIMPLFLLEK